MSSLLSQSSNPQIPKPTLPMLTSAADYPLYLKEVKILLRSNFGAIGQSIIKNTPVPLEILQPQPTYDDLRINARTKQPIVGSRMYAQVTKTQAQIDDANFDDADLDLTEAAKLLFSKHNDAHIDSKAACKKELKEFRELDDQLLNLLYSTQTLAIKEILSSNKKYPAFDALSSNCITRSETYLAIMNDQFSKGNSKSNINEITKFLFLTQEPNETEAAWTNRLVEHFNRVEPILSPATSVEVLLRMLLCMVLIKGTDRHKYSNMRAIEVFIDKYPDLLDSLQHFEELRTGILSRVNGDLNQKDDPVSAQSSAFLATIENPSSALLTAITPPAADRKSKPPKGPPFIKGAQRAGRTDHCTYCLAQFSKYHYHKLQDCNFKQRGITATSANIAATTPIIPPTDEQVRSYLASLGLIITDDAEV